MDTKPGAFGMEGLADLSLGTHFCLFYETEQDLLETLALYFKPGLVNHELCLWITPISIEKARNTLREAFPSGDQHLEAGAIEIISCEEWYCEDDVFDATRVIQAFDTKLAQALAQGYRRLRVLADEAWLSQEHWRAFSDYEGRLDEQLANKPIHIVCAYPTHAHNAADILDIARTHRFIAAKRNGTWEILEAPELKHAKAESEKFEEDQAQERTDDLSRMIQALQAEIIEQRRSEEALRTNEYRLQAAIDAADIVLWERDLPSGRLTWLGHSEKVLGFAPGQFDGTLASFEKCVHPEDLEELRQLRQRALEERSEYSNEYRVIWPDGSIHWLSAQGRFIYNEAGQPVRMYGAVLNITERQQAEAELQKNKEILQTVFDNVPVMITMVDKDGQFILTNRDFESRLGWHPDELSEQSLDMLAELYPDPQDRQAVLDFADRADGRWEDFKTRAKDGRVIDTSWAIVRLSDGSIIGVGKDNTEQKRIEDALRDSESKLKEAQELAHIGYWERDLLADRIVCSEETRRIFGRESLAGAISQAELQAMIHPDDRHIQQEALNQTIQGAQRYDVEYRIVRPDGEMRFLHSRDQVIKDETGRPVRLFGTVQDITERKQAEEARRQAEELFRAIVEDQTELIVRWKPEGTRTFVNKAYCRTFGKPYEELVGTSFWPLVAEPYRERELERIRRLTPEAPFSTAEHESLLPDGTTQWQEWTDRGFFDGQGHLVELQSVGRDITERKRAEEALRQHAAQMEALVEISRTFAEAGLDYESVLKAVARRTAELLGDMCIMSLYSENDQEVFSIPLHHTDPEALALLREAFSQLRGQVRDRDSYLRLRAGESIYVPVVDPDEYRARLRPELWPYLDAVGVSSLLAVPLKAHGRVIGALYNTRVRPGKPYTHDDQVLLQNIADRAALTIQNARLFDQAEGARNRLSALSRRLLEVQEAERRALTTELHDRVGQNLTGLSINLQNMKASLSPEDAHALAAKFNDAQALVEDTSRQIRDIMAELHLPELEDYGLAAALETYAERAASRGNLELIADLPDLDPPRLPSNVRATLFRAAQEAISNVLKHANATQLEVSLEGQNGRVRLKIEDNGQGFEPDLVSQKEAQTWGLQIMRERIESIGGNIQIESKPGEGTRVTFEIERPS